MHPARQLGFTHAVVEALTGDAHQKQATLRSISRKGGNKLLELLKKVSPEAAAKLRTPGAASGMAPQHAARLRRRRAENIGAGTAGLGAGLGVQGISSLLDSGQQPPAPQL